MQLNKCVFCNTGEAQRVPRYCFIARVNLFDKTGELLVYWLKFNIYSILLTLLAMILLAGFVLFPVLHQYWWEYLIFIPLIWAIQHFADHIFCNFSYKLEIREMLIEKSKDHFDQRLFIPYMDSPCMRNVVFFTLAELNRKDDYHAIVKRTVNGRKWNICPSSNNVHTRRSVKSSFFNREV